MSTDELILQQLRKNLANFDINTPFSSIQTDATNLAKQLHIDRANLSRRLNRLHRSGILVKTEGRPTRFLLRSLVNSVLSDSESYVPSILPKNKTLAFYKATKNTTVKDLPKKKLAFEHYIMNDRSRMAKVISEVQAAILYPPAGLNVLLYGPKFVGKSTFSKDIVLFAQQSGVISEQQSPIIFDCATYNFDSFDHAKTLLFGNKNKSSEAVGLLEQTKNSFLILDHIESLPHKILQLLTNKWSNYKKTRIIGIYTASSLPKEMMEMFPVKTCIPALDQRSIEEVLVLALQIFQQETKRINKTIHVPKEVLKCFLMAHYKNNIAQLQSEIQGACARALYKSGNRNSIYIELTLYDLSESLLNCIQLEPSRRDEMDAFLNLFQNDSLTFSALRNNLELDFIYRLNRNIPFHQLQNFQEVSGEIKKNCREYIAHITTLPLNAVHSLLLQDIYASLLPSFHDMDILKNEKLLYGLLYHLSSVIRSIRQGNIQDYHLAPLAENEQQDFKNGVIACEKTSKSKYREIALQIASILHARYMLSLPEYEIKYIEVYLELSSIWINKVYIQLILFSKDADLLQNYKVYLNNINENVTTHSFSLPNTNRETEFLSNSNLEEKNAESCASLIKFLKEVDRGKGVVLATDNVDTLQHLLPNPLPKNLLIIPNLNLAQLAQLLEKMNSLNCTLEELKVNIPTPTESKKSMTGDRHTLDLLKDLSENAFTDILIFLNPQKACQFLYKSLTGILSDLHLTISDEILIRFLYHGVFLIERCIKKEPLNDTKSKIAIKNHPEIFYSIEKNFVTLEETFSFHLPLSEMGMLIEMFVNYRQE